MNNSKILIFTFFLFLFSSCGTAGHKNKKVSHQYIDDQFQKNKALCFQLSNSCFPKEQESSDLVSYLCFHIAYKAFFNAHIKKVLKIAEKEMSGTNYSSKEEELNHILKIINGSIKNKEILTNLLQTGSINFKEIFKNAGERCEQEQKEKNFVEGLSRKN